jgi:predicted amidohydrolase YtcJ
MPAGASHIPVKGAPLETSRRVPDLILYNGLVQTQDPLQPTAEAVAVSGNRLAAVGSDTAIKALAGIDTQEIDLHGRLVLPGLIDSHFHYYEWARLHQGIDLSGCRSLQQLVQVLRQAAAQTAPGNWILGWGWTETGWPENRMPSASTLNAATTDHPVILWRGDLHLAVANTPALQKAGIGPQTADPDQGSIDRDSRGQPSGLLRELAINLIKAKLPHPPLTALTDTMRSGFTFLHALGITGLHDVRLMGGLESPLAWQAWQQLDTDHDLAVRCWAGLPGERLDAAIALGLKTGWGSDRLRIGHVKYFRDGSMGARTAWLLKPYRDGGSGMPLTPLDAIAHAAYKADQAGLAVMVHAIGDRANRDLVALFANLVRQRERTRTELYAGPDILHRIEHLQMIHPADLDRLADLGVAASVQPHHLAQDMDMIDRELGKRGRHCYLFRSILKAGIPLIFGSDYPVCDPNPMTGIHSAVTRQTLLGRPSDGWYPDQRLTVDEAVRAYTSTPAQVSGSGHELGSLTAGKLADLVVLDRNIYAIPPNEIQYARAVMTIFDGQIVYER